MQTGAPLGSERDGGRDLPGNSRRWLAPGRLTRPQGTVQNQEMLLACKIFMCCYTQANPPQLQVIQLHRCRQRHFRQHILRQPSEQDHLASSTLHPGDGLLGQPG